jgi:hypothetical protein
MPKVQRLRSARALLGIYRVPQELIAEIRLPVELIISEAKRWEVADEVALQVLPTGRVNVLWSTPRASEFVEYLSSLEARTSRN